MSMGQFILPIKTEKFTKSKVNDERKMIWGRLQCRLSSKEKHPKVTQEEHIAYAKTTKQEDSSWQRHKFIHQKKGEKKEKFTALMLIRQLILPTKMEQITKKQVKDERKRYGGDYSAACPVKRRIQNHEKTMQQVKAKGRWQKRRQRKEQTSITLWPMYPPFTTVQI